MANGVACSASRVFDAIYSSTDFEMTGEVSWRWRANNLRLDHATGGRASVFCVASGHLCLLIALQIPSVHLLGRREHVCKALIALHV